MGIQPHPLKVILDEEGLRYDRVAERVGIRSDRFHHYLAGRRGMPEWVIASVASMVPHRREEILALGEMPELAGAVTPAA